MKQKRLRTKLFRVWLHPNELKFLSSYSEAKMLTASEVIRGWIYEVMKRERYELKEPSLPEQKYKKR